MYVKILASSKSKKKIRVNIYIYREREKKYAINSKKKGCELQTFVFKCG